MGLLSGAGPIGGAIQGVIGLGQLAGGLLSKKPQRPEYVVQNEYAKNAYDAEQLAKQGLPDAQYQQAQQNLGRNQAGAIRAASNLGGGSALKSLNNILASSNNASLALDVQDAAARRNNMLLAMQQRGILAGQKQAAWDYNKNQPYQQAYQNRQRLIGAGMQNLVGGAQTMTGVNAYNPNPYGYGQQVPPATMGDTRRAVSDMGSMPSMGYGGILNGQ